MANKRHTINFRDIFDYDIRLTPEKKNPSAKFTRFRKDLVKPQAWFFFFVKNRLNKNRLSPH